MTVCLQKTKQVFIFVVMSGQCHYSSVGIMMLSSSHLITNYGSVLEFLIFHTTPPLILVLTFPDLPVKYESSFLSGNLTDRFCSQ